MKNNIEFNIDTLSNKNQIYNSLFEIGRDFDAIDSIRKAFVYLDIDNFRYINSTIGHLRGNLVISKIHEILTNTLLSWKFGKGKAYRVNADEFILIIYDFKNLSWLDRSIGEMLKNIKKDPWFESLGIFVTLSAGISINKVNGSNIYDLLPKADTALYCAKIRGKDRHQFYSDHMSKSVYEEIDMSHKIRTAINANIFEMHYQPIVSTKPGTLVGLEALIRWKDHEEGYIPPARFIPIAEKTGQMKSIEKLVIDSVFLQVKQWIDKKDAPLFVSINLSPEGLVQQHIIPFLEDMKEKYQFPPEKIQFEITETAMIRNEIHVLQTLNCIKQMGFRISLDDFGTGYSSINYLRVLPIDKVKLDKSFLLSIENDPKNQEIVETVIDLCHKLKLEVVAEGVETESQRAYLIDIGCDYIQGYLFSKPLNSEEISKWIAETYFK